MELYIHLQKVWLRNDFDGLAENAYKGPTIDIFLLLQILGCVLRGYPMDTTLGLWKFIAQISNFQTANVDR